MRRPEDPRKVLRHRLAMMSITLDGDDRPPRARLVWSLVEHKGQPVDPDEPAYATGVDPIDPLTLAAIADLYGDPRGYLTAPGGDPAQEDRIDTISSRSAPPTRGHVTPALMSPSVTHPSRSRQQRK